MAKSDKISLDIFGWKFPFWLDFSFLILLPYVLIINFIIKNHGKGYAVKKPAEKEISSQTRLFCTKKLCSQTIITFFVTTALCCTDVFLKKYIEGFEIWTFLKMSIFSK
jgi:predicted MFS family arabinose efflux permease